MTRIPFTEKDKKRINNYMNYDLGQITGGKKKKTRIIKRRKTQRRKTQRRKPIRRHK
jgi:hypothetical protein